MDLSQIALSHRGIFIVTVSFQRKICIIEIGSVGNLSCTDLAVLSKTTSTSYFRWIYHKLLCLTEVFLQLVLSFKGICLIEEIVLSRFVKSRFHYNNYTITPVTKNVFESIKQQGI